MPINATDGMVTITVKKKRSIDAKLQYILAEGRWLKDATGMAAIASCSGLELPPKVLTVLFSNIPPEFVEAS